MATSVTAPPVSSQVELVLRAARGDARSFEDLVVGTSERTYRIARAILGNEPDARDATQEAYVSAWRELARLRDPETFEAWLRAILVNACRARMRGRRRIREISLDPDVAYRQPGPSAPDQIADSDLLDRAFERLDVDKRAILALHYLDHEQVVDIARGLGVPVGTAKWRLSEARAALGRALAAEGEPRS